MVYDTVYLLLQVITLLLSFYGLYFILRIYLNRKGRSMEHFYYLSLLVFVLIILLSFISIFSIFPTMRWDLIYQFTLIILVITLIYMTRYLKRTIDGYEELLKTKRKPVFRDVE